MDRLTAENYKPQTIKAYRGLLKRLISLIEAAGISPQDLTAERAAELVRNDVLPKALPVITGVRGWYGAPRGGVAQPAWQHRRASARQHHYAAAHGCSRRARAARSEEHTSELQSLMRNSYAVFRLKKKKPRIFYTLISRIPSHHHTNARTQKLSYLSRRNIHPSTTISSTHNQIDPPHNSNHTSTSTPHSKLYTTH